MIYFLQPTDGGPVKIGHTDNLPRRHKQLEARYGCELAILATMEGGRDEEAAIHDRFARLRFGGVAGGRMPEQFRPAPELMSFIRRPLLVGANPETVEAMPVVGPIAAVVLKDTPEYRDWLTGLSDATLIPVATIVRDALAKWAEDRGLPGPPGTVTKSQRRIGDRGPKGRGPKR